MLHSPNPAQLTSREFYAAVIERLKITKEEIKFLKRQLSRDTDYSLNVGKRGKSFQCYLRNNNTRAVRYISKKNPEAAKYAQAEYAEKALGILEKRYSHLKGLLKNTSPKIVDDLYNQSAEPRKAMIAPIDMCGEKLAADFLSEEYESKEFTGNEIIHTTANGERVRSKSEVMIADELARRKIPYKYECLQNVGNVKIYPDFTILNKNTGRVVLWEHFGMLDDQNYRDSMLHKIRTYESAGLIPGRSVFFTYETGRVPLTKTDINRIIDLIMMQ